MWNDKESDDYISDVRWFAKKHPNELKATEDNYDTYLGALRDGFRPAQLTNLGCVHREQGGVLAIDQSGHGKMRQARLYVFPDERTKTLHKIRLRLKEGKGRQGSDVQECVRFVRSLTAA